MSRGNHQSTDEVYSDYRTSHLHKGPFYDEDLSANVWTAYLTQQEQNIIRTIVKKLFPRRPVRCMDFACGTGRLTVTLEDLVEECIGIDVSSGMLEKAKKKCKKSSFLVCDLTKDTPDLGRFDFITAFRFFGNAQNELRAETLSALHCYLDHGGYLVLNNHRNPNAPQNFLYRWTGGTSDMNLTFAKLRRQAEICGFKVVDIYGIGGWTLRHRWQSWVENPSMRVWLLEGIARLRIFATFAPDWIVVLRKSPVDRRSGQSRAARL